MTSETSWGDFALTDDVRSSRSMPPRSAGATMVIDTGLGVTATQDIIELAGRWIDHWKLSFGTSVFVPEAVLRRKLELLRTAGFETFPGGTLFEAAIVRHHCRPFMNRVREMGFSAVEVSDGTIDLPPERRQRVIECALNAGLTVFSEVGKKDPKLQPSPEYLAEQTLQDLDWGSSWVIVEGRESGTGVGVFDSSGVIDLGAVDIIADCAGVAQDRLIWEAPLKDQQVALINRFGINVNLGNIDPSRVLALEALRSGLRFETLKPIADRLRRSGDWQPEVPEPADEVS